MLYYIGRHFFLLIYKIFFRFKVFGIENIPEKGGCVLCSNHLSYLDPITIACILKRRIYFMAKEELFKNAFFSFILTKLGAFPVKRDSADIGAVKKSIALLKSGKIFGIFPEGTRNQTGVIRAPEPGVSLIAIKSKTPLIPVLIKSKYRIFKPVTVIVGQPLDLSEYYDKKATSEQLEEVGAELLKRFYKLNEETAYENHNS